MSMGAKWNEATAAMVAVSEEAARRLDASPYDPEVRALASSTIRQLCAMVTTMAESQNRLSEMLDAANARTNDVLTRVERMVGVTHADKERSP